MGKCQSTEPVQELVFTLVNRRDFLDCRVNMEKGMYYTEVKTSLQVNSTF